MAIFVLHWGYKHTMTRTLKRKLARGASTTRLPCQCSFTLPGGHRISTIGRVHAHRHAWKGPSIKLCGGEFAVHFHYRTSEYMAGMTPFYQETSNGRIIPCTVFSMLHPARKQMVPDSGSVQRSVPTGFSAQPTWYA